MVITPLEVIQCRHWYQ